EDLAQAPAALLGAEGELLQSVSVRMTGETFQILDLATYLVLLAEDAHVLASFLQAPAQSVIRHVAGDQHQVVLLADGIAKMMQYAAGFAHARCGNDDERPGHDVQVLALLHVLRVGQQLEAERVWIRAQQVADLAIEALGVGVENLRHVGREWAVHIARNAGQFPGVEQVIQDVDDFLRAADAEGRDDDLSLPLHGLLDQLEQLPAQVLRRLVQPVAVGGLHDQVVRVAGDLALAQDRMIAAADVATVYDARLLAVLLHVNLRDGGAKDVSRLKESQFHPIDDGRVAIVAGGHHHGEHVLGVLDGIERIDTRLA